MARGLWLGLVMLGLWFTPLVRADEGNKDPEQPINIKDKLSEEDAKDKILKNSFHKVHTVKLTGGKFYKLDLMSPEFDTFLRLEDADGKKLAEDDDGGDGLNSRLVYKVPQTGEYRVVVTSFAPNQKGKYTLNLVPAGPADVLLVRAQKIATVPAPERRQLLADLLKHFAERKEGLSLKDMPLVFKVSYPLENIDPKLAIENYDNFSKLLAKSSEPKVAEFAKRLEGAGRRMQLPGQDMAVKGATMEGKPLDWNSYRGKVVLVDFWATWCGPCRAEIPNMQKMYEAYKGRGFEIVGVSLDRSREQLEKFLEEKKLPWICLHEKEAKGGHPLAEYYGVFGIPLAILVDREGKVVSLHARGGELTRLLEKLIGPLEKEKKAEK